MHLGGSILLVLLLSLGSARAQTVAAKDLRRAEKLMDRASRLQAEGKFEEAEAALAEAARLNPGDPTLLVGKEYVRQQRVAEHLNRGNELMDKGQRSEAAVEFQAALALDPTNTFAEQRFLDAGGTALLAPPEVLQDTSTYATESDLTPRAVIQSFDYRGDSRGLWQTIARAYGLTVLFDDTFVSRSQRFRIQDVSFAVAAFAARRVTKAFIIPTSPTEFLVATDTPDSRRRLETVSLRTFYLPSAGTPQELQEVANMLRTLFDVRFVNANPNSSLITVRAPKSVLDAAERLLAGIASARPQITLDVKAFEITDTSSRNIGIGLPYQFTAFNLNTEARKLGNLPNLQDLLNKIASGQPLSASDQAALAALLASSAATNSILFQPFATFGGGITRTGVAIPAITATFDASRFSARSLEHATLRAEQGKAATFQVGTRFPVLTASFSPLLISSLPVANPNNNLQPLTPSFQYEDLGINLKATPTVGADRAVSLQFELTIKGLAGQSFNGIPTISNREYRGAIRLKDGETSILAGEISSTESRSLRSFPFVGSIPGLQNLFGTTQKQTGTSQVLIVVTPHVVSPARTTNEQPESYLD